MSKGTVRLIEIAAGIVIIAAFITITLVLTERLNPPVISQVPSPTASSKTTLKEYKNLEYKFSFNYPMEDYTLNERTDNSGSIIFNIELKNNKNKLPIQFSIYKMDRNNLNEYIQAQTENTGTLSPLSYRIESAKQSNRNGYGTMELILSPQGDTPPSYTVVFARGDNAYLFFNNGYINKAVSKDNDKIFEQIVNSFRFIE